MVSEEKANQEVTSQQQENTPSPGAMLKARRETLGLSQQDIADKLFLKAKQINDLENDVIDEKSSVTFTKGYVRNYAKQLGMNSQEVIEAFETLPQSNICTVFREITELFKACRKTDTR